MIPRECQCGHVMLEHEYHGRCLVTVCACRRYDEVVGDKAPRTGAPPTRTTSDQ